MPGAAKSTIALLGVVLFPLGCGGAASRVADSRRNAALAAEQGSTAYAKGDYAAAAEQLQAALAAGGMTPDLYASVRVKLAVCYAATGKLQEAAEALDSLEKSAPNLDEVFAARSFVLKKQGKAAEARDALNKARRFNPRVQEIKG